ncbi:MAG: serine/threonine-protein phosphatase, partial [Chloroflexi bacterium]|nr:serine/threonine-protein phosphatase [Chloroflexota bacterium]
MKLRHSARTDVGKTRDHNEDDFGVGEGAGVEQYGELLVVCDGMGGHAAGEVASHLGVETILSSYYGDPSEDRTEVLQKAFERANERIHAEGRGTMGTTGVAALLYQGMLHIANVGDSRAYLIRDGAIRQISRDHSLVGEQVAAGVITAEQARSLYYRNVITRALGYQSEVVVDLFHYPLQAGDTIVLSSDGLHGLVTDDEICQTALTLPLTDAVDRLIDLANERGGTDNITAIIAHVDDLDLPAAHAAERTAADQPTVELPVTVVPDQSLEEETPAPAVGAAMPGELAISPAATLRPRAAYEPPAPRRLTWHGALLAFVLFAALSAVTLFVAYPSVLAPGISAPPPTAAAPTAPPPTAAAPTAPPPT